METPVGVASVLLFGTQSGHTQQTQTVYRIGLVEAGNASANQLFVDAFMAGLRDLGDLPDKNIVVDVRWAEGTAEGFRRHLAELLQLRPDVLVVSSVVGALEAKRATSSIPVVFIGVGDPVESGLVKGLAQPGGNLTGLARAAGEGLVGKTVQVLTEIAPGRTRLAILWNPESPIKGLTQAEDAARTCAITSIPVEVRRPDGLQAAFATMREQRANALFVVTDPLTLANRKVIVDLASSNRIPAGYEFGEFVRAGGLVAYTLSITDQFRRAAIYVDKILHGAKPAELPIEQPTKFELMINLKAAKALGLTVPKEMLLRADEVIQ
jgi:putative ABC transport system substrate-binding protein